MNGGWPSCRLKTNTVVQYSTVQYSVLHAVWEEDGEGRASNFCEKISGPQSSNNKIIDKFHG